MDNVFKKLIIPRYYFSNLEKYLKLDLYNYLLNNLDEEIRILVWNLGNTLTINANGKHI